MSTPRVPIYNRPPNRLDLAPSASDQALALYDARLSRLASGTNTPQAAICGRLPDRLDLVPCSSTQVLGLYGVQFNPSTSTTGTGASA
jgi:hypothetical protein